MPLPFSSWTNGREQSVFKIKTTYTFIYNTINVPKDGVDTEKVKKKKKMKSPRPKFRMSGIR